MILDMTARTNYFAGLTLAFVFRGSFLLGTGGGTGGGLSGSAPPAPGAGSPLLLLMGVGG